ncbi:MAG: uroporphyrinogen-III C-methyltransferase [Verrucomicrobium sp.]|nr:uroporphyrinogen-III C-methyltransferase [Verrucomicrobium sp.]
MKAGVAYLVGAGPGDPGLLTLRGRELLERADVVVYDYLCNPELLRHAPDGAELVYAGKSAGHHTLTQAEINALLVAKVAAGRVVVRLKGGDPFVFGRGGEEAEALADAGLSFEIVPGVSSSIAAAAYAGIPVTHRSLASSFTVLTGHEEPGKKDSSLDWETLAKLPGTKVLLMGVERLRALAERLVLAGARPDLPIALVRWGTWTRQQTLTGTLETIADLAEAQAFQPPAVAILGDVVTLADKLAWFQKKPLFGQRVVVPRTRRQAGGLTARLRELGADVLEIPTIRVEPAPLPEGALDFSCDWLLFTSPNGADFFFDAFLARHGDVRKLGAARIGAVGPATAARVRARALAVDRQPSAFTVDALVASFSPEETRGKRFVLARGGQANPELPAALRAAGAEVTELSLYQTLPAEGTDPASAAARTRFVEEGAHWIAFTSGSTVENWKRLGLTPAAGPTPRALSIGPVTTRALEGEPVLEAKEQTLAGLVDTLLENLS